MFLAFKHNGAKEFWIYKTLFVKSNKLQGCRKFWKSGGLRSNSMNSVMEYLCINIGCTKYEVINHPLNPLRLKQVVYTWLLDHVIYPKLRIKLLTVVTSWVTHKMTTLTILSETNCHFVNLLSFHSSLVDYLAQVI